MKTIYSSILFAFIISTTLLAQTTPHQMVAKMGRGINLGNVLSAPIEGNWAPPVQESYFEDIAVVGFKTVRIPIRFDTYTTPLSSVNYTDGNGNYIGSVSNYTVSTSYLNRVEQVVDWALSKGLVAIIDVHGDHWYWDSYKVGDPAYKTGADLLAAEDRFKAIWTAISNRFQNKSEDLLFEIMNEAYFSMSEAEVDNTNTTILNIIRATNPTRNVIVNGGKKNSYEAPLQMGTSYPNNNNYLYNDNYLIATFHYYLPRAFTASADATNNDNDWGTAADKTSVDTHFGIVKSWSQTVNVPVLLGEFGADNEGGYNYSTGTYGLNGGPDVTSRAEFHKYLAQKAIDLGFAFTVWDAGDESNKTIYKVANRDWVVDVRNAVLNAQCTSSGIIDNSNVECNYDSVWQLSKTNGASARITNALLADAYNNSKSIKITLTTAGSNAESVILNNKTATTGFTIGDNLVFKCFAKGSSNQTFNIRIKAVINGVTVYQTSTPFNLTAAYQEFSLPYTILDNTTSLEFQVLCGLNAGDYYFDNFSSTSVVTGNYYYDGSGSLSDLTNWGSNTNGTGVNPLNFTADSQTFTIRNTTTVTTTAPWTVSGSGSKIVVGDPTQAGVVLTVVNTFPITGIIELQSASSGVNSLVWQDKTATPSLGTMHSSSEVHFQPATSATYTFATTPTFGKLFFDGLGSVSLGAGIQNVQTSLNVAQGSTLNLNFNPTSWMFLNAGTNVTINGTIKSPKLAGIFSYGIASPGISTGGSLQFNDLVPNLILSTTSTAEYSRSSSGVNSTQIISTLPSGISYNNLLLSEVPSSFSTTKTINAPIAVTGKLTVNQSTNSGSTFNTGGFLTLKSTAVQTAVVAPVVGTISGNVIAERYIPSGFRAYRLLSSPVTTTTSIKENWQENSLNSNPNPGYGTHITGAGGNVNGFDTTTSNQPSLYTHNNFGVPASWTALTNTAGVLTAGFPYLIYIRGSKQDSNILSTTNDATTLRVTGVLKTGSQTFSSLNDQAEGFSLIGNPYQAQVDMQAVLNSSTNLNKTFYYVLEPKMGTKGQYVTVNVETNMNTGGSTANRYLQPWQGGFVKTIASGPASLSIVETNKYDGASQTSVFKTSSTPSTLKIQLFDKATLEKNGFPVDGLVIDFNLNNSNSLDQNDAIKIINFDENIAVLNSNKLLSYESRTTPTEADEIQLNVFNHKGTQYTLKLESNSLTGPIAYLEDKYQATTTEIPQDGTLNYDFNIDDSILASKATDRFKIIYAKTLGFDQNNTNVKSLNLYKNKDVLTINSSSEAIDEVNIFDIQGRLLKSKKDCNSPIVTFDNLEMKNQVIVITIKMINGFVASRKYIY